MSAPNPATGELSHSYSPLLPSVIHLVLTPDELAALAGWSPAAPRSLEYRDSLAVAILATLGLRRAELCDLRQENFTIASGRPWIHRMRGKGGRLRSLPISPSLYRRLVVYWDALELDDITGPALCISRAPWRAMSTLALHHLVKKRTAEILGHPVRCHMLRHSVATAWIHSGVDIRTVQLLLGHSSMSSTERYLHSSPDDMIRAVATIQPADPELFTSESRRKLYGSHT